MKKEVTQFSRIEFESLMESMYAPDETPKSKGILMFRAAASDPKSAVNAQFGGIKNIKTIRVLSDDNGELSIDLIPVIPPKMLREREEKEREAQAAKPQPQKRKERPRKPKSTSRKDFLKSPEGKQAAYDAALKQRSTQRVQKKPVEVVKVVALKPTPLSK